MKWFRKQDLANCRKLAIERAAPMPNDVGSALHRGGRPLGNAMIIRLRGPHPFTGKMADPTHA